MTSGIPPSGPYEDSRYGSNRALDLNVIPVGTRFEGGPDRPFKLIEAPPRRIVGSYRTRKDAQDAQRERARVTPAKHYWIES